MIPTLKHYCDIVSDVSSGSIYGIFILTFFLAYTLTCLSDIRFGSSSDKLSGIYSEILFGILSGILSDILSGIVSGIHSGFFLAYVSVISSDIPSGILSDISSKILCGRGPAGKLRSSACG